MTVTCSLSRAHMYSHLGQQRNNSMDKGAFGFGTLSDPTDWNDVGWNLPQIFMPSFLVHPCATPYHASPAKTRRLESCSTSHIALYFLCYGWGCVRLIKQGQHALTQMAMNVRNRFGSLPALWLFLILLCLFQIFFKGINRGYQRGRQLIDGGTHPAKRRFKISGHEMRSRN